MADLWWRLVRFGFRLLYYEMAFTYDLVSGVVSLGAWRHWQRAALPHLPPPDQGAVLELAHGTGSLHQDLLSAGYHLVGIDLSSYMGSIARRKLTRVGMHPSLVRADAQALPFADVSFSGIVTTFPTNFFLLPAALREAHRVLRPGGVWVIVINGMLTEGGLLSSFLEFLYRITGQRGNTPPDLTDMFAAYGFGLHMVQAQCDGSVAQVLIAVRD